MSKHYTRAQYRAWWAVKHAIATGALLRPEHCAHCNRKPGKNRAGRSLIEAHHYKGYAKRYRLTVVFLCSSCHKLADRGADTCQPSGTAQSRQVIANLFALRAERATPNP